MYVYTVCILLSCRNLLFQYFQKPSFPSILNVKCTCCSTYIIVSLYLYEFRLCTVYIVQIQVVNLYSAFHSTFHLCTYSTIFWYQNLKIYIFQTENGGCHRRRYCENASSFWRGRIRRVHLLLIELILILIFVQIGLAPIVKI